jgi:hypothetical protein
MGETRRPPAQRRRLEKISARRFILCLPAGVLVISGQNPMARSPGQSKFEEIRKYFRLSARECFLLPDLPTAPLNAKRCTKN